MNTEEKRKKLESFMERSENLRSLQQAYEFKRALAVDTAVHTDGVEKAKTDTHKNGTERKFIDCAAALDAYTKYAEEFSTLENEIINALWDIKDPALQSLMRKRYLCGYTEQRLADELEISLETLRRKLSKGVDMIKLK